jgi:hypothetical protein
MKLYTEEEVLNALKELQRKVSINLDYLDELLFTKKFPWALVVEPKSWGKVLTNRKHIENEKIATACMNFMSMHLDYLL